MVTAVVVCVLMADAQQRDGTRRHRDCFELVARRQAGENRRGRAKRDENKEGAEVESKIFMTGVRLQVCRSDLHSEVPVRIGWRSECLIWKQNGRLTRKIRGTGEAVAIRSSRRDGEHDRTRASKETEGD